MRRVTIAVVATVLVAALGAPSSGAARKKKAVRAQGVIAFTDSGINPYHVAYRDRSPRAYKHPSTYLKGFPANATALRLTLDASDYAQALIKDCSAVWSKVREGRLYWIPGTKIVGAISFGPQAHEICGAGTRILDDDGHGTMTTSRAVSDKYGACPDCRVVMMQMPGGVDFADPESSTSHAVSAITFAARNSSWIDAQSNSWGPLVAGWEPTGKAGLVVASPRLVRAAEAVSRRHLAFWASGNGAAGRVGVIGHPTLAAPHMTPSAILVGGHDSGRVATWPGFSAHVVSDSCASWAAHHQSVTQYGDSIGSGTSAASPFAAAGAVRILMEARSILGDTRSGVHGKTVAEGDSGIVDRGPLKDGDLTLSEWRRVTFHAATERPKRQLEDGPYCAPGPYGAAPIEWREVPADYPEHVQIGYGAIDRPAIKRAKKVLRGAMREPQRAEVDEYFARERAARHAAYEVFSKP